MKILITGGSGVLGQYLNCHLSRFNEILTLYHTKEGNCHKFNNAKADVNDSLRLRHLFAMFRPNTVIHTAAISNPVLPPHITPAEVYKTNVKATADIAELCNHVNAKMIYISTDLVYAGYRGSFLKEDAKLIPASLYAETKLMGEKKTEDLAENYLILRTALLYGFGLNKAENFFNYMYRNFKSGKPVRLFKDQYRSPLSLHCAAKMMEQILESDLNNTVVNFGGIERLSRLELGELMCKAGGFDRNLIEPVSLNDMPEIPKVEDVSLDVSLLSELGITSSPADKSLVEIFKKMNEFCPE